jgi:Fic family protein
MYVSEIISNWRVKTGKPMRELVKLSGIDQALISKYERGKRLPSERHLAQLAKAMGHSYDKLRKLLLADKVLELLEYEDQAESILKLAENRVEYLKSEKVFDVPKLSKEILKKLDQIDLLREQWQSKKPLDGIQLKKMEEYFHVKYTYESNRIEGNTLTYQETHLVVHEGLTIGGKSMVEHLEAINHQEAIDWVMTLVRGKEDLDKRNLLSLHHLILKSIDSRNAGKYRDVPVRIGGSEHVPPQPYLIGKLMEDYFIHYEKQQAKLHPVLLAAEMHERLVSIHPFIDGNGRTSRLVMNFILLRHGYTLANLKGDEESRMAYYQALERVQLDADPEPFYHLILDRVKESLEEHLELV